MKTPLHHFRKDKAKTAKIVKYENAEKTTYEICFYRGGQLFEVLGMPSLVDCISHLRAMGYKETSKKDFQKTPEDFEGFCLGFVMAGFLILAAILVFLYRLKQFQHFNQ